MKLLLWLHRLFRLLLCFIAAVMGYFVVVILVLICCVLTDGGPDTVDCWDIADHYDWWADGYDSIVNGVIDFLKRELG